MTAVDAERAFAAHAQRAGQWTAFRATAAPDAVMFVDEQVDAQTWLKDRADPPASVMWWPGESYVSCDGTFAVNTGPWVQRGGKSVGYFTTLWRREPDGRWRWLLDHGDTLAAPRPATDRPRIRRATCRRAGAAAVPLPRPVQDSHDGSLRWRWSVAPGERRFRAELWNGRTFETVIDDVVRTAP